MRVQIEASGPGVEIVRLIDGRSQATIAVDRLEGEHGRASLVSADARVVALKLGNGDADNSLALYAIDRADAAAPPAGGAGTSQVVSQVLVYRPRDGRLEVSLREVPNGTVVDVESGRHAPLWHKTFFRERASRTWYEWPRQLTAGDPTNGLPARVGSLPAHGTDRAAKTPAPTPPPYSSYTRPLAVAIPSATPAPIPASVR